MESVWWALKTIWDKGLLYEGHKVVPYCPRCGTALSSHEVALGYKDVVDPSVYVRFPVPDGGGPLEPGDELIVWTTTPWTLVSNAAVAVDPDLTYVRARSGDGTARSCSPRRSCRRCSATTRRSSPASRAASSTACATSRRSRSSRRRSTASAATPCCSADFVTADDGSGLVHTAIAFGEDDFRLGREAGLNVVNPVRLDGTYDERIGPYAGRFVKDADADLVEDLRARGRLLRSEDYEHAYPHCWRCGTPLLYYAKPSWYIATSTLRDRLLANNDQIDWHPPHIHDGRFGEWLRGNVDWALSRERYWGTPLPVWRCEAGHAHCVGSLDRAGGAVGHAARRPAPPVRRRRRPSRARSASRR